MFRFSFVLVVVFAANAANADTLLWTSSGYPDPSHTDGHPWMMSYEEIGWAAGYAATAQPVTFDQPVVVQRIGLVGYTPDDLAVDLTPTIDIFSSDLIFIQHQGMGGDIVDHELGTLLSWELFGNPNPINSGYLKYYLQIDVPDVELEAGTYWFATMMGGTGQDFTGVESDLDFGSAIVSDSWNPPGNYLVWEDRPGYTTGTEALDIYGEFVPEPSSLMLITAGLLSVAARSRLRRRPT